MYKNILSICKFSYRAEQLNRTRPIVRLASDFLSGTPKMSFVTYEEVEDLPNRPEVVLVDVRDPPEIKDTGKIPTSINIPRK